jgi:hypothetical protein
MKHTFTTYKNNLEKKSLPYSRKENHDLQLIHKETYVFIKEDE